MKRINLLFTGQELDEYILEELPAKFNVSVLPFIKTELLVNKQLIEQLNFIIETETQVIITSNVAARWITKYAAYVPKWRIACMTGKTQNILVTNKWENLIVLTDQKSELLAENVEKVFSKSQKVYFITGDRHLNIIPLYLSKKGFDIETIITYHTKEVEQNMEVNYDGIIFLSPSAVKSFFRQHKISIEIPLFAIGETTATALKKIVFNPIITSSKPTQKILFHTIQQFFK